MVKQQSRFTSLIQSLKKVDKVKLAKGIKALSLAIITLSVGSLIVRAPALHKAYIRAKVGPKVLMLMNQPANSGGTGFYVKAPSGNTYIVTNSHVCNIPGKQLFAEIPNARRVKLRIREISRETDLCLLEQPGAKNGLRVSSSLDIGDQVEILGHPRLFPLASTSGEYTGNLYDVKIPLALGECSPDLEGPMVNDTLTVEFFGQPIKLSVCSLHVPTAGISTAKSLGGNSGSPVVNWKGDVVGVVFGGLTDNNDALIIPLKDLQTFLKPY